MGGVKPVFAGFVGALVFLFLYLLFVWFQFYLLGDSWFLHCLGPYSPLVIRIGRIGINLMPIMIDAVVLAILTLANLNSLNALGKALGLTAIASLTIASTASLAYSLIVHGLSGLTIYEFNSLTILVALVIDVVAITAVCMLIRARECLRTRAFALVTYTNALIIDYLIDSVNSVVIAVVKELEPVIGALGPADGLVIDPLLITLMAFLTLQLSRKQ
ncbi:hypothetical protein [Vulcanisaeta distributa]|uniref:hypothetical protein n=1 Tax=Vulcanisaeta distributa TaxID=164451 RepID=UPI001FB32146|nr:hypothetical protein [Vulcanisaeta distributa]